MRIKITEIEANARELRESNTLAGNLANLLSRCFQNNEPFEDDYESEKEDEPFEDDYESEEEDE